MIDPLGAKCDNRTKKKAKQGIRTHPVGSSPNTPARRGAPAAKIGNEQAVVEKEKHYPRK